MADYNDDDNNNYRDNNDDDDLDGDDDVRLLNMLMKLTVMIMMAIMTVMMMMMMMMIMMRMRMMSMMIITTRMIHFYIKIMTSFAILMNEIDNAGKTPKWCYIATENHVNGVAAIVVMQWVVPQAVCNYLKDY